ncbi:MAG: patatin-like phospholipase family protein [Kiritimatiellia bacterium]
MKRLLTIDGGGIRGVLALEILREIEASIRLRHGVALHQYFDLIAGTSTGAIIATCLAWGMTVEQVATLYHERASDIFAPNLWHRRHKSRFRNDRFDAFLRKTLVEADGSPATLGTQCLKTLLLVVMRNATTGSSWPICNNPAALYNDRSLSDCNLDLPLWQIVRASTAAPTYFEPERLALGDQRFHFIDGAVSPYNNPSQIAFLFATLPEYRINFETGEERLLLVSVGTGMTRKYPMPMAIESMHLLDQVKFSFNLLIDSVTAHEDLLCRLWGRCLVGDQLDSEIGDLKHNNLIPNKLFTYLRYNPLFTREEIIHPALGNLLELDNLSAMDFLRAAGASYAKTTVTKEHLL